MLDFQLSQTPFRFGVDEGTDPKQVPPGTLLTCKDLVWLKSGRLQKRQGTTTLTQDITGGGTISAAKRLIVRGSELALTDGTNLYSYSPSAASWRTIGLHPTISAVWSTAFDGTVGVVCFDSVVLSNGTIVDAWVTGDPALMAFGTIYYQIRDASTGALLTSPTAISGVADAGMRIRLVASAAVWVLLWVEVGTGRLKATTSTGNTTLKSDAYVATADSSCLDAYVIGTDFVATYTLAAGGMRLIRYSIATTPIEATTSVVVAGEGSSGIQSVTLAAATGQTLYLAYFDATNVRVRFAAANPATLAQTVAPTLVETSAGMAAGTVALEIESVTTCLLVYSYTGAGVMQAGKLQSASITSAGAITSGQQLYFHRPLSRPIAVNGRFYVVSSTDVLSFMGISIGAVLSNDTFLVDVTRDGSVEPFREACKIDALIGGVYVRGFVSSPTLTSTGFFLPVPYLSALPPGFTGWRVAARGVTFGNGQGPLDMWRSVQIGGEAYLASGVLTAYDGAEAVGYGWPHGPYVDANNTVVVNVGFGPILNGTYTYTWTAERRSAVGVLHRSPTGKPISFTITGGAGNAGKITIALIASSLGHATRSPGHFAVYRSTLATPGVLQRLTIEPSFMFKADSGLTFPTSLADTYADAGIGAGASISLATRPALYTAGGELEDTQPPSLTTCCLYRNRIFGIAGDERTLWFTKSYTSNPGIAPGFNPAMRVVFNERCVGLAVLDERLIVFHERGISYFSGDGPALNGDNSDYGEPSKLQTDVGCLTPRGIVSTPMGIMFVGGDASVSEIHLLNRKLSLNWVGKPVQDLLLSYPNVTSAVLVSTKNEVRFSCNNAAADAGIVLVYNYEENQWSHFEYDAAFDEGLGRIVAQPIADACLHNDVYTFVTTNGTVYKESGATWLDNGHFVKPRIETAWMHATGPLNYQSVRTFQLDGVSMSAHGLDISVGFNGDTSYAQGPASFSEGLSTVTDTGPSAAKVSIGTRRKCRSIRFKIEETLPAVYGTGQGAIWSTMGIEVGVKKGPGRLAIASQK